MDSDQVIPAFFKGRAGVLATMHAKERVISPILEDALDIKIIVPEGFNSDLFGTFTGDIARRGNQLEAARAKAESAMTQHGLTLGFASEGTFGPHPASPFLPYNREIVLMIDKLNSLEIIGVAGTTRTNFSQRAVTNYLEAYQFAVTAGFPEHGVVVKGKQHAGTPVEMVKGITSQEQMEHAVLSALSKSDTGEITIETDMRAMYNPTRMQNIEAATRDLVTNICNLCPKCSCPGFKLIEDRKGLPCEWCGFPTRLSLAHIYTCRRCGYTQERMYPNGIMKADPGRCPHCNP